MKQKAKPGSEPVTEDGDAGCPATGRQPAARNRDVTARPGNYAEILDDWNFEGALRQAFLEVMGEAEKRRQGAAFRIFGNNGKASRFEVKFVDGPMSKEEADRRGFQLLVFPQQVWQGLDA